MQFLKELEEVHVIGSRWRWLSDSKVNYEHRKHKNLGNFTINETCKFRALKTLNFSLLKQTTFLVARQVE